MLRSPRVLGQFSWACLLLRPKVVCWEVEEEVEVGIGVGVDEEMDEEKEEEEEERVVDVEVAGLDVETEAGEEECFAAALGEAEAGLDAAGGLAGWVEVLDCRGPLPGKLEGGSADDTVVAVPALEAGWARPEWLVLPDRETIARAP